jgi:hypothetical protein
MTDMRATERLLEYIGEQALAAFSELPGDSEAALQADKVMNAIAELRRRGDTLVRREDLRLIAAGANHGKFRGPLGDGLHGLRRCAPVDRERAR